MFGKYSIVDHMSNNFKSSKIEQCHLFVVIIITVFNCRPHMREYSAIINLNSLLMSL